MSENVSAWEWARDNYSVVNYEVSQYAGSYLWIVWWHYKRMPDCQELWGQFTVKLTDVMNRATPTGQPGTLHEYIRDHIDAVLSHRASA